MRRSNHSMKPSKAISVLTGVLLCCGLLFSAVASAAYQQVGNFAGQPGLLKQNKDRNEFPEEVQFGGLGGMAVNYTGAGGVPAGTLYAAAEENVAARVARYNPDRSFSEAWDVTLGPSYGRCGPAVGTNCPPRPSAGKGDLDVDVDQTTGNVYVFNYLLGNAGSPLITEYSADGSKVIARFGIKAPSEDTVAASPDKIHASVEVQSMAVNGAGEVFVFDEGKPNFYHRLMRFKPKTPGDYTEYEYAGQSQDISAGFLNETHFPTKAVTDAAGYVYVSSEEHIEKFDPAHPADPPICSLFFKKGGITTMTINPLTGEVFLYSYLERKLHRLNPCVEGKFTDAETIEFSPFRAELRAMTVDPVGHFEPGRPAGILYMGSPTAEGGEVKGTSPNEEGESALGYVFAPPFESPPQVVSEAVSGVTSSSARLEGTVNPLGNPTHYVFQYISDTAYQANEPGERFAGAREAPAGGARIEGSKPIPVAFTVGGLSAGTEYHFRIVASNHCHFTEPNVECVAEGPGRTVRTYPVEPPGLPDNRAYELVSPVQKYGGQVIPMSSKISSCQGECKPGFVDDRLPMQSAPDGNAIVYQGTPFSFDDSALIENQYIARRDGSGWHTTNLTPVQGPSRNQSGYRAFTADLGIGVITMYGRELTPEGPSGYSNIYTQPTSEPGSLTRLLTEPPPNRSQGSANNSLVLSFAGGSADFSHLFFSANDALTPEALGGPESKTNLYERFGEELRLVNFAPGDATTLPGAVFGSGILLRRGNPNIPDSFVIHAISADGSRAFWTSEGDGHLYVREDGETTRQIPDSGSCATSLTPSQRVCFLTASADGSKVLLSDGHLYDVNEEEPMTDLTQGKGGFEGVVGQSEDLSHIYFADTAALTGEEQNGHGDKAQEGKANLYSWHDGVTTFVATLAKGDSGDWEFAPIHRSAASSPNGHWLAFTSLASLTGFDNTGSCISDNKKGFVSGPCGEVFLYRADTGELRCASCNRTGAPPRGGAHLTTPQSESLTLPVSRYLTDSGRLFFDSQDSLTQGDTNGRVEDVYEFEPEGVGSCVEAGCVKLISLGRSGIDSNFVTADPSGRNVFFTSRDQLVPADPDDLVDLYDAREGGGFPPSVGSSECQGEACLPSVSPPNDPTPSTVGLHGPGNVTEKTQRCPKGRRAVQRKGKVRCVKRSKRHSGQRRPNRVHGGAK